jgi:hypothetical protein
MSSITQSAKRVALPSLRQVAAPPNHAPARRNGSLVSILAGQRRVSCHPIAFKITDINGIAGPACDGAAERYEIPRNMKVRMANANG